MPSISTFPRVSGLDAGPITNIPADVQQADGSTKTVRIQLSDLLEATVKLAGGAGLPVLDANGHLVLGGCPVFGVNSDGHLVCVAAIPDTNDGFVPVPGSGVIYTDGGIFKRAV